MDLKKWFNETVRDKVLKVLDQLAAEFKNDQGKADWRKAVDVFSKFCDNQLQPPLKKIVEQVIEELKLTDEVEGIRTFWNKTPKQVRDILTKSLKDYQQPISWDVLGKSGKGLSYGNLAGPLGNMIGFNATASLQLGLQSHAGNTQAIKNMNLQCGDNQRFLDMWLLGKLEADASVALPLGFVSAKGSGDVKSTLGLNYYYVDDAEKLFIEALVNGMTCLASPFDSVDIAKEGTHRLKAIHLNVDGSLEAAMNISGGKTWGTSFKVKSDSLDLDTEVKVGASVSAAYDASLKLNGNWDVLVKPVDANILNVKVQKIKSKEKTSTFTLDASVGAAGLDVIGNAVIKKFMPSPDELLTKLQEYSNLGDMLKKEVVTNLNDLLDVQSDDTLKKELVNVLVGDASADQLAETIGNTVENALNGQLDLLENKAADAGQKILQSTADKLNLPGNLGAKLVATASEKMNSFLDNIEGKLKGTLVDIINNNRDKLANLLKPLDMVSKITADLTEDVNQLASKLLAPVIKYLTRYQKFRNDLINAVKKSVEVKIALHLGRSLKTTGSTETMMEFTVDTSKEIAQKHYKDIITGNFNGVLKALPPEEGIQFVGGSFKTELEKSLTTDVSLQFFGIDFKAETIMKSTVSVQTDGAGNISISSKSSYQKIISAKGESQMVEFVNLMELPGTAQMAGNDKTLKLLSSGLTISYRDEDLKKSEIGNYLKRLMEMQLISIDNQDMILRRYEVLAATAKEKGQDIGAEITLSMPLNSNDMKLLVESTENEVQSVAIQKQIDAYFLTHRDKEDKFDKYLQAWGQPQDNLETKIKQMGKTSNVLFAIDPKGRGVFGLQDKYLRIAWHIGQNSVSFKKMINIMKVMTSKNFEPENPGSAGAKDIERRNQEIRDEITKYNKQFNKYLRQWLKVKGLFSALGLASAGLPYITLAFMAIVGRMCNMGQDGKEFLPVAIKWSTLDWKEELYV
jgi:hypothetical protein